jgi:2-polyprenyl-6-methoxyphenol hydroxylase-like FAD-dependent oxidoreductase
LGVKVERETEMVDFAQTNGSITASLRLPNGTTETVESAWLSGCDGGHSTVRHRTGKEFVGETRNDEWLLADVHFKGYSQLREIAITFHPSGVLALFPLGGSRYRIIASVQRSTGSTQASAQWSEPTLAEVQSILDERGLVGVTAYDAVWLNYFGINERKVEDYRDGRVFLAGDAAHVHSPAGGQGMNTGMQDAFNLAWKLALVIKGQSPEEPLLSSYSTERSAIARLLLEATGKVTSIAVLKGEVSQAIRNHVMALIFGLHAVREEMPKILSELAVEYRHSPLNRQSGAVRHGPAPGERAPIVEDTDPVGAGNAPRFALFAQPGAEASHVLSSFPSLLEPTPRIPFLEGGVWIVRPDGYVGFRGSDSDLAAAADYMAQFSKPAETKATAS